MSMNDHADYKKTGSAYHGMDRNRFANNISTIRSDALLWNLPSVKQSRNLAEGRLKVLRLYTRTCKVFPFIIRIWGLQKKVTVPQAKNNIANWIRQSSHLRRSEDIDEQVTRGIFLQEIKIKFF